MNAVTPAHGTPAARRAWLLPALVGAVAVAAAQPNALLPGGRYTLTTQTVMPHLEESLRYATARETRCVGEGEVGSLFPVLANASLRGCWLGEARTDAGRVRLPLECASDTVASGEARLGVTPARISAVLEVRMGGKNMTFSQRVTGLRLGACD